MVAGMRSLIPLTAVTCLLATPILAQTTQTWSTNTAGSNWSVPGNWSPAGSPEGNDIIFGDAFGETANPTTVGNVVDTSFTVNSLTYNNTGVSGNFWQVTDIAAGQALTVNSASLTPPATIFSVANTTASASTRVAIRGSGTLVINEAASGIYVGVSTASSSAVLDMSALASFSATVATVSFGTSRGNGDVTLAGSNSITATTMTIGESILSTGGGTRSDLLLGTSNVFNVDTINVGRSFAAGSVGFRTGLTNPTVTIRGSAGGSSRADLTIGNTLTTNVTNAQPGSYVDFTASGGSVDARLDDLLIGRRGDAGSTTTYSGSLSMNKGVIDATTVTLGQSAGTGALANSTTGVLTVAGGTFTAGSISMADNVTGATSVIGNLNVSGSANVTVTGSVTAGRRVGTAASVAANIAISGGTLLIQGDLKEGTGAAGVTSTVALSGGVLNMDHGAISVDTFAFTGGTLKDVASFEAGATGGLNVQNSSSLAFGLDGGFTTLSLTGDLILGASSNLSLALANGFTPGGNFLLVSNDGGDLITGSFATINGVAFGLGNTFSLTNNLGTFDYQLVYNGGIGGNDLLIQAVPEPSAALLLGFSAGAVLIFRRRRGKC